MGKLKEAVDARKNYLINRLIVAGYTKMDDGRQLYELPLADLERMNIHIACCQAPKYKIDEPNI
jgi:hypothetical protein